MANNEINTKGIINSIDNFNENSEKICASLNGLEASLNEFNKSISKLDDLKEIDLTKQKIDQLKVYKDKVDKTIEGLKTIEGDLSGIENLIETISKFSEEIQSVMKNSNAISFNSVSKNVRELDKRITAFNKKIDTFVQSELLKKMDAQYESLIEHFNSALEKQQKTIASMEEKLNQIESQSGQITGLAPAKIDPSKIVFDGFDKDNMEGLFKDFIKEIISEYTKVEPSKASIYRGFSENVLKVLSDEGELEASYILGQRYYELGQIDMAVVEYEKLVDGGDDRCKDRLIEIYKEKSNEGNALYQEKLGFELYRGKIIEKDVDEAIKLLEKAESNGSTNAKKYLELIRLK
ncbi:hypothetical protein [Intestinibacter sp.]|uniref:hypothetical protein n=1 Tax=Intestinibacter sp. TaxID=1965304 RepID=UPI003F177616